MSGRRPSETRAAKRRRYKALRQGGVSQEALLLTGLGRATGWSIDKEFGFGSNPEPKAPPPNPKAEGNSELEQRVRELERTGVAPPGVSDAFDHKPQDAGVPDLVVPDYGAIVPRRGDLLLVQGQRGTQSIGDLGESVHPDDVFPVPTSGRPHTPVVVHIGRELPSDIHRRARLESHR